MPTTLWAGVHFTLQSSLNSNSLGLRAQSDLDASGSVAFDLGTYFRVGVSHRHSSKTLEGYGQIMGRGDTYFYTREQTQISANSLDFTIILYYGELLVPYVQLGMVKKYYVITNIVGSDEPSVFKVPQGPVPNGGIGVGIRLSNNFSLKLSYIVSPSVRQLGPDVELEPVLDSYSSVGISYNI